MRKRERMDFEMKMAAFSINAVELARVGADVAAVIVSTDGKNIYTLATSDFETILAKCLETENHPEFHHFKPERDEMPMPVEIDVLREGAQMLKRALMKVLDKDISGINIYEVIELEKQFKEWKAKALTNRLTDCRIQSDQLAQEKQMLRIQIAEANAEIERYLRSTRRERNARLRTEFLPSTSTSAASTATDNSQIGSDSSDDDTDSEASLLAWLPNKERRASGTRQSNIPHTNQLDSCDHVSSLNANTHTS